MQTSAGDACRSSSTFQAVIGRLQAFWEEQGCVIVQPYHTGARLRALRLARSGG